jgi:hypothetical protein
VRLRLQISQEWASHAQKNTTSPQRICPSSSVTDRNVRNPISLKSSVRLKILRAAVGAGNQNYGLKASQLERLC